MLFNIFGQIVLSIFKHFDHEFQFFVELGKSAILLLLELLLDFDNIILKNFSLCDGRLNFLS